MDKKSKIYFLKVFLYVLAFSFVLDKLVFFSLNVISDNVKTGLGIGKLNHYLTFADKSDILIFGSSRANHHVDPIAITNNGYNMGMDGSQIAYAAALIKSLPKEKKQTILLHIGASNFVQKDYDGSDLKALHTKYIRNKKIREEIDKWNQNNTLQKFYWSLSYNGVLMAVLKNYFLPSYNTDKYRGYDPLTVNDGQREIFQKILKRETKVECPKNLEINRIYENQLKELQSFCSKNNKRLIVFTAPLYEDPCKTDNKVLSSFLEENKIRYYDFTDFFKDKNDLKYWKDNSHLSREGAELFTKEIKKIYNSIQDINNEISPIQ